MESKRIIINWSITYFLTTMIVVYILQIPYIISGQKDLVYEYYYENMFGSLIFDYFLVAIYLLAGWYVWKQFNLESKLQRSLTLVLTTIFISGSFMIYYRNKTPDSSFFYRWFRDAGIRTILYDIILLIATYHIFLIVENFNK